MSMQEFSDNLSTLSYVSQRRIPLWIYDPKKKSFLGRTMLSWFLCVLFYLVYYACLAGFFCGLLWIFLFLNVPEDHPARSGVQNILNFRPGLGFRPLLDSQKSLIHYATTDPQGYIPYTENINAFLNTYVDINSKPAEQFANCTLASKQPNNIEKVCKFSLEELGPCNKKNYYGYPNGTPCVIIKLNKIYGWLPDIENPSLAKHALLKCGGQNIGDVDNIGELAYHPNVTHQGKFYGVFNSAYFPFVGQPGYLSPIVGVQFKSPKKNVLILVKCELLNLKNSFLGELGFELMVD